MTILDGLWFQIGRALADLAMLAGFLTALGIAFCVIVVVLVTRERYRRWRRTHVASKLWRRSP